MKYIWDKMYVEPTAGGTFYEVLASIRDALPEGSTILRAFELNHVPKGQKISFGGARFGTRVVFESEMEPPNVLALLKSKEIASCTEFQQVFLANDQKFPPRYGDFTPGSRLELMFATVQFSHGRGATTAKQENATRGNQAKDTKNKLNLESNNVGSAIKNLQKHVVESHGVQLFSNAFFYLERDLEGGSGSSGGAYQFHASAEAIVNELLETSRGRWWKDDGASVFTFNATELIDVPEDPRAWYQYQRGFMEAILKPFDEEKGTGGTRAWEARRGVPEYELEDLEYYAKRLSHPSRTPSMTMGSERGFFPGLEETFARDVVLSPWVFSEIVALVQAYMLSHMPRYWAGTTPDVMLLREVREE